MYALEKYVDFFSDRTVVVQPTELQGKAYNLLLAVRLRWMVIHGLT